MHLLLSSTPTKAAIQEAYPTPILPSDILAERPPVQKFELAKVAFWMTWMRMDTGKRGRRGHAGPHSEVARAHLELDGDVDHYGTPQKHLCSLI